MKYLFLLLVVTVLFWIAVPVLAQQPIGPQPIGTPLSPHPDTQLSIFIPPPAPFSTLAPAPLTPPPLPPPNHPSVRHAVVIEQSFLYGFNLWSGEFQFGCNRAPSMRMITQLGDRITVQVNPGRGLDAGTWVRVLDGWMQDCYIELWGLRLL